MAQTAPLRKASGCNILTTVAFSCQVVSSLGAGSPAARPLWRIEPWAALCTGAHGGTDSK
ncbi:hypothetical protein ACS6IM_14260 [Enterobacter hormaechei subsp. steigerwaltii]